MNPRDPREKVLADTAELVSAPSGPRFFKTLVKHAARTLRLDYVHIAKRLPDAGRVETLAAWLDGEPIPNWSYDLAGTPCAEVLDVARRCYISNVSRRFPHDTDLQKLHAEGYIGEPVLSSSGEVLGLIVGISRTPLEDATLVQATLRILAARAGAELDHRAALAEMRRERDWVHNILQTVEAIIVALDPHGRITLINRKGCQLLGYEEAELIGQNWFTTCLPEGIDVEDIRDIHRKVLTNALKGQEYFENPIRTRHGEHRLIAWHNSPLRGSQGEIIGGLSAGEDVTERRRAERRLAESELQYRTLADSGQALIWAAGTDALCYYFNRVWLDFTGRTLEQEAGNGWMEGVHPEDYEQCLATYMSAFARRAKFSMEYRLRRHDGVYHWIQDDGGPRYDSTGEFVGYLGYCLDITDRKEAEAQIRSLAYFDPLTGLPNRRLLMDRLSQALIASGRSERHGAVLMLDLDHFKSLNDTQGHDVGDRLLIEVARRIRQILRQQDTVSRLGGDEYVIMLEDLGADEVLAANEAELVAEKVRAALDEPYETSALEQAHCCTPSIGVTLFRGTRTPAEGLLKQADVALYQAKDAGRNTVRFFNPQMQIAIESRMRLEAALRRALTRDELRLHYQPQMDLLGRCLGVEALLRWQHPEQGMIAPAEFIPLAEETGLILPIGRWVIETACAQLKDWEGDPRTQALKLAINVSARQFHQPDFVSQVTESLTRFGVNPSQLKLELTESAFLENRVQVGERMEQLKRLGVGFSLDDFGTGYSSLSYLKRLPFDQLKIDQAFVRDITTDPSDAAIVTAILAMSRSLGLEIVAEGVETEAQLEFLRRNGCHAFQGYFFGKPQPVEALNLI